MEIIIPIVTAVITGTFALLGTYFANRKSAALMDYRLEQLEHKIGMYNNLVERTYRLEETSAVHDEKIKVANHRIDAIEKKLG